MEIRENDDRDLMAGSTYLSGVKGHEIHAWYQAPESEPVGMLCLVHGLGEHSGRYLDMVHFMNERRIVVVGYDHAGHGRSGGRRGWVPESQLLHDDLERVLMYARSIYPDIPLILFGHSMGGNLVANYLIHDKSREISGAVISSGWFRLSVHTPAFLMLLGKVLVKVWPGFRIGNRIDPALLSNDEAEVAAYRHDPLVHNKISAGLFFDLVRDGEYAIEHAANIHVPLLVAHGTEDMMTSFDASVQFADQVGKKASFQPWEGSRHEPHNDKYREKIFRKYTDWILDQL
jgi:alpha-beta hydrolase superfamily lysophospholipase